VDSLLGILSLIPVVGTITGLLRISADAASRATDSIRNKKACWALAPEVAKVLSKHRIAKKAAEIIERHG